MDFDYQGLLDRRRKKFSDDKLVVLDMFLDRGASAERILNVIGAPTPIWTISHRRVFQVVDMNTDERLAAHRTSFLPESIGGQWLTPDYAQRVMKDLALYTNEDDLAKRDPHLVMHRLTPIKIIEV